MKEVGESRGEDIGDTVPMDCSGTGAVREGIKRD